MSKKRLQPRSVGRIINDLEKDQTVIITESEQTPPMERLRQKAALGLYYETLSVVSPGQFVPPPFPAEWIPDVMVDFFAISENEDTDYIEGPFSELIGRHSKAKNIICYVCDGACTFSNGKIHRAKVKHFDVLTPTQYAARKQKVLVV